MTPIQAGSGTTAPPDPDGDVDDGSQSSLDAAADGGPDDRADGKRIDDALKRWIETKATEHVQGAPAGRVIPAVAGDLGADPDTVEYRLEQLKQNGVVYEPAAGRLRRS